MQAAPEGDVFKVAVFLGNGTMYNCGFVKGLGVNIDALSSSLCHGILGDVSFIDLAESPFCDVER